MAAAMPRAIIIFFIGLLTFPGKISSRYHNEIYIIITYEKKRQKEIQEAAGL